MTFFAYTYSLTILGYGRTLGLNPVRVAPKGARPSTLYAITSSMVVDGSKLVPFFKPKTFVTAKNREFLTNYYEQCNVVFN